MDARLATAVAAAASGTPQTASAAVAALESSPVGAAAALGELLRLEQFPPAALDSVLGHLAEEPAGGASAADRRNGDSGAALLNSTAAYLCSAGLTATWEGPSSEEAGEGNQRPAGIPVTGTAASLFTAIRHLARSPRAVKVLSASPRFHVDWPEDGLQLRQHTLLGAALSAGVAKPGIETQDSRLRQLMEAFPFNGAEGGYQQEAREAGEQRIQQHVALRAHAFRASFESFLRSGADGRRAAMRWVGKALECGAAYRKTMRTEEQQISRYGYAALCRAAVSLALPVIGQRNYFPREMPTEYLFAPRRVAWMRFPLDEETIISGEKAAPLDAGDAMVAEGVNPSAAGDEDTQQQPLGDFPPKVHLFFLALHSLAVFFTPALREQHDMQMRLSHPAVPQQQKPVIAALHAEYAALLSDRDAGRELLTFANGAAAWLLQVLQVDEHGAVPTPLPARWANLPLNIIEDIFNVVQLVCGFEDHRMPPLRDASFFEIDKIASLMLAIMGNASAFPKAHTHVVFPRLFLMLTDPRSPLRGGFANHQWFVAHAMRSCVQCYIIVQPCEQERVAARHYLSISMEELLQDSAVTSAMRVLYNDKSDTTLERLCTMLTGEATAAVDGAFEGLSKMRELELTAGRQVPTEAKAAGEYRDQGGSVKNHLLLATTAVRLFSRLVDEFREGMARHMVVHQISAALVKFIMQLAGPKASELKISTAEEYGFKPRELLQLIVSCFVKFGQSETFRRQCVGAVTSLEEFYFATERTMSRGLVDSLTAGQLAEMVQRIKASEEAIRREDEVFDDPPDWALCGLMYDLLVDPVAIPMEGDELTLVNRESIRHNLLSSAVNPFTRKPLTFDEVEEFTAKTDVRERIDDTMQRVAQWKEEQRVEARRSKLKAAESA